MATTHMDLLKQYQVIQVAEDLGMNLWQEPGVIVLEQEVEQELVREDILPRLLAWGTAARCRDHQAHKIQR